VAWPDPFGRLVRLRRIGQLDPQADHVEIYRLPALYEFPWDCRRSLELAPRPSALHGK